MQNFWWPFHIQECSVKYKTERNRGNWKMVLWIWTSEWSDIRRENQIGKYKIQMYEMAWTFAFLSPLDKHQLKTMHRFVKFVPLIRSWNKWTYYYFKGRTQQENTKEGLKWVNSLFVVVWVMVFRIYIWRICKKDNLQSRSQNIKKCKG